ncbi:hypothetical protein [Aquisphaera insulae]|uniref:hypothetical protein n=1 Tax=Aquisphaera insulae TaxID=2712864 RepID=UPI0013EDF6E8|nr:hypothetical protein [Aquisphaera insulae]
MRKPRAAGYPGRMSLESLEDRRLLSGIVGPVEPTVPVIYVARTSLVGPLSPGQGGGDSPLGLEGQDSGLAIGRVLSAVRSLAFTPAGMMGSGRSGPMIGINASAESLAAIGSPAAATTDSQATATTTDFRAANPSAIVPAFSARPWVAAGWGWQGGNRPWQRSEDATGNETFGPGAASWSSGQPPGILSFRDPSSGNTTLPDHGQILGQGQGLAQQVEAILQHVHEEIGLQNVLGGAIGPAGVPLPPWMTPPAVAQGRSSDPAPPTIAAGVQALPPTAAPTSPAKEGGPRLALSVSDIVARGGAMELTAGLQPALLLSNIISGLIPGGVLPQSQAPADLGYRPGTGADPASAGGEAQVQDGAASAESEAEGVLPALEGAGLIAEALPVDGRSLQAAIERFLDRLTDLTPGESDPAAPSRGGPISVGVLGLLAMTLAARQRLRNRQPSSSARREERDGEQSLEFPELPGSWSTRLT